MAQTVVLTDDTDGTPAAETVAFTIDGVAYEIDLSATNAAAFRSVVAPYAQAGRRALAKATKATSPRATTATTARRPGGLTPEEAAAIRAWARDNGYEIAERGRIGKDVITAYRDAQA